LKQISPDITSKHLEKHTTGIRDISYPEQRTGFWISIGEESTEPMTHQYRQLELSEFEGSVNESLNLEGGKRTGEGKA
jgi:hypothetical protein